MSPPPAEEVEAAAMFCCMPWSNPGSSVELVSPLAAAACCRAAWEGHKHKKCNLVYRTKDTYEEESDFSDGPYS